MTEVSKPKIKPEYNKPACKPCKAPDAEYMKPAVKRKGKDPVSGQPAKTPTSTTNSKVDKA